MTYESKKSYLDKRKHRVQRVIKYYVARIRDVTQGNRREKSLSLEQTFSVKE